MIEDLAKIPLFIRQRLSGALESGLLNSPVSATVLKAAVGPIENANEVVNALEELASLGISGRSAAVWLKTLDRVTNTQMAPDMVWSGPPVPKLNARDTRRVYDEVLSTAERSIWISTYAYFDGPRAFDVLAKHMDNIPTLQTTLLLNISRKKGDRRSTDELVRRFADRFWKKDWPGSKRPNVFYDPRSLDEDGPGAVLHAKAVVADDHAVLVTSANLTEAALDRNIELGLYLRDRALAKSITSHFRVLIEKEILVMLPAN